LISLGFVEVLSAAGDTCRYQFNSSAIDNPQAQTNQSGMIALLNVRQNSSTAFNPSVRDPSDNRFTNALPTIAASASQFITCRAYSGCKIPTPIPMQQSKLC
jgi:hypothetical protein